MIRVRPWYKRLVRLPKMWSQQWKSLKGVEFLVKISFIWNSTKIVMKKR